jgi:prepilin-type N-terminal cleavage/methylation domain-containing protein
VPTERRLGEEGYTLIEVVMAMVILAVGLLGLEAVGIGAARSIATADRQSGYATIASDSLESAMHQLRRGTTPRQFCESDLSHGDRLSRSVTMVNAQLATVTVRAIPNPDSFNAPSESFEMSSSIYLQAAIPGAVLGQPC